MFATLTWTLASFPRWLTVLLAISLLGNLYALFSIGMLPDEAYYWVWSQRLALSYYDHPPLVGWLMWPFTELFGNGVVVVRLQAVLSWLVGAIIGYDLTRRLYGDRVAGALAVLVWSSLPIVQVGFHIVTPDSPLIIFTWLVYYFAYLAVAERKPMLWLAVGASVGLTLLAKYPAVLVLGGLFFTLIFTREGRAELTTRWPWLGVGLAFLLFMPVVIWNAQHDWISFAFQFSHGVKEKVAASAGELFLLFLGGQLLVPMPWSFFAMLWASFRPGKLSSYNHLLLSFGFLTPLVIFGLAGLTTTSAANWPETAYVPGTVLLAGLLWRWLYYNDDVVSRGKVALISVLMLIGVALIDVMRFPAIFSWFGMEEATKQRTQLSQSYGWNVVRDELRKQLPGIDQQYGADCTILLDNHARAGMVAWLLDEPYRVNVTADTRINQYNLWNREQPPTKACLYIAKYDGEKWQRGEVPVQASLPEGDWLRIKLLEVNNPDHTISWFAFYLPETPTVR
jgi:4-amino-4-deoxy-L-arabinose transferase-like glycosyltransferase